MKTGADTVKSYERKVSEILYLGKKLGEKLNEIKGNRETTIYLQQQMCLGYRDLLKDIVVCWILMLYCDKVDHYYYQ
jgi:hypothetical protein